MNSTSITAVSGITANSPADGEWAAQSLEYLALDNTGDGIHVVKKSGDTRLTDNVNIAYVFPCTYSKGTYRLTATASAMKRSMSFTLSADADVVFRICARNYVRNFSAYSISDLELYKLTVPLIGVRSNGAVLKMESDTDGEKYPCYKVVNSKGELSRAYAFGGIDEQKRRLEADGIVVENGKVDLKRYGYGVTEYAKKAIR